MINSKKIFAFTLLEVTVTVALVVLMLTLSTISYRRANKRSELVLTSHQVAGQLRLAESYAASIQEFEGEQKNNIWGVYVKKSDNKKIIMFVDKNRNGVYDEANGEKYRQLDFPFQIRLANVYRKTGTEESVPVPEIAGEVGLSITFVPPDPKVRFCQDGGSCSDNWTSGWSEGWDTVRLLLQDDYNQSVKNVYINTFGLIDVPLLYGL